MKNLVEYIEKSANLFPDKVALRYEDETVTYAELRNKAMNIATRPETIDEINADIIESGFDIPVYEYGHLDYGKQSAFIKGIEYPDPNNETDTTEIDGTKYYLLPALLVDLLRLFGIETNTVPVNTEPDIPEMVPTKPENDIPENGNGNTTENGNGNGNG